MKRKLFFAAIFAVAMVVAPSAKAFDFSAVSPSGHTLYYNIYDSTANTVYVTAPCDTARYYVNMWTGYTKPTGNVVIPSTVTHNGVQYTVTIIWTCLASCTGVTSVTIPSTATRIGGGAFYGCTGLTNVTIPNGVKSIERSVFGNCTNLQTVNMPDSLHTIGDYTFYGCTNLTIPPLPNGLTSIGISAFYDCSSLATSLVIPNTVTHIGDWAFRGTTSLTSITLPNNLDTIRTSTFVMSGLTSVNIPSSVICICDRAFGWCQGLTSVVIPNSVDSIGKQAFNYDSNLTKVVVSPSVTAIGVNAFYNCVSLDTVWLMPQMPPTLGTNAFYNTGYRKFILNGCTYNSYANNSYWSEFASSMRQPIYDINFSLTTNNDGGYANIQLGPDNRVVRCDSTVVVEAFSNYGYHFDHWSTNSYSNPETIHLTGDSTVMAYFAPNSYTLTLQSDDPNLGTVSGGGTYNYLDTATITATATDHHHFVRWSDNSTENPRQYIIYGNASLTAYFAIDTHTVSVQANDIARGSVEASGTHFVYGTPCTVSATSYTGYTFSSWSNGVTANPYTFAVLSDVELVAFFVAEGEEVYTVTVESADPTMGTVSGGGQALSGGEVTIRATPNEGYRFVRWQDNDTNAVRTVTVTADITYTAYFASLTEGISDVDATNVVLYTIDGSIVLRGTEGATVSIYDMMGRLVATREKTPVTDEQLKIAVPAAGVYLVKVGNLPARKVVVIK